jgi:hypothetical protein
MRRRRNTQAAAFTKRVAAGKEIAPEARRFGAEHDKSRRQR